VRTVEETPRFDVKTTERFVSGDHDRCDHNSATHVHDTPHSLAYLMTVSRELVRSRVKSVEHVQPRPYRALVGCKTQGSYSEVSFTVRGAYHHQCITHPCPDIHVLANALYSRRLVEVAGSDTFSGGRRQLARIKLISPSHTPDDIPIGSARDHFHLLLLHDVLELTPDLPRLAQELWVEKMLHAPMIVVPASPSASGLSPR
jgi:hypothetical protein